MARLVPKGSVVKRPDVNTGKKLLFKIKVLSVMCIIEAITIIALLTTI